jgi:hypothetical protein
LARGYYFKNTKRNFLTKNNTAPAGIKRAKRSSKYGASPGYKWLPTRSIPYIFMITDGITSANINNSKYLFIIDDGSIGVDDDVVDSVVVLAAFCILNPKINDDVPIKKETIVRTFCVRPGMIAIGVPWLVCCC